MITDPDDEPGKGGACVGPVIILLFIIAGGLMWGFLRLLQWLGFHPN